MNKYNTTMIMRVYADNGGDAIKHQVAATNGNAKLGKAIFNINLPPVVTCNPKAPCFKECYGRRGHFSFSNTKHRMLENLLAFCQNPKKFFEDVASQTSLSKYVRWFGDGDMPNMEFLEGMCKVARKNPQTLYLSFTKQYGIVNDYIALGHRIPKNLRIVFSCWKNWIPDNPYNFPTTWVRFPETGKNGRISLTNMENKAYNALIPTKAFECKYACKDCQHCWHMRKGESVVFKKH